MDLTTTCRSFPVWLTLTLALLITCATGGCATATGLPAVKSPDGIALELFIAQSGQRFSRYRVEPDRTLRFAGGFDAAQGNEFTWSGTLSDEDAATVRHMIDDAGWLHTSPPSADAPPDLRYELAVRTATAGNRFRVRGENEDLRALHDLLREAAEARFQPYLDALPKAGDPIGP